MRAFTPIRRTFIAILSIPILFTLAATPALAGNPSGGNQADDPSYVEPGSEAFLAAKLSLAQANEEYAATGIWNGDAGQGGISPDMICATCGGGGGSPPSSKTLDVRARRQENNHYCGPASGQEIINWSRGYFYDNLGGENTTTNHRTQTQIAGYMGTTGGGTNGGPIAKALNGTAVERGETPADGVLKPSPDFAYSYDAPADGAEFHSWIVTDIADWSMPLAPDVRPHKNADTLYYLPSWPRADSSAVHWIVIRGYDGFWDGTDNQTVYYVDSSGQTGPGRYPVGALTMWKVTKFLYGKVVW